MALSTYVVCYFCAVLLGDVTTAHRTSHSRIGEDMFAESSDTAEYRPKSKQSRPDSKQSKTPSKGGYNPNPGGAIKGTKFGYKRRMEVHPLAIKQLTEDGYAANPGDKVHEIWIWYEFPPLEGYGRDRDTPSKSVMRHLDDAMRYLDVPKLRSNMLETFQAAAEAMERQNSYKPYNVFDQSYGRRKPQGTYLQGPRGSFLVRAAATLFAAAAYYKFDYQVHHAALGVIGYFTGDLSYSDMGSGSTRDREGDWKYKWSGKALSVPLYKCDLAILKIIEVGEEVCQPYSEEEFESLKTQADNYDEEDGY